jgi:hypothetical protein
MRRTRWIKVEATIVECFRAWEEPATSSHPSFQIIADIKTANGEVQRVSSQQRLDTRTHHWRAPDPGDVVQARWDPEHRKLRLDLRGDLRYDERRITAAGRTREAPTWPPTGIGGVG